MMDLMVWPSSNRSTTTYLTARKKRWILNLIWLLVNSRDLPWDTNKFSLLSCGKYCFVKKLPEFKQKKPPAYLEMLINCAKSCTNVRLCAHISAISAHNNIPLITYGTFANENTREFTISNIEFTLTLFWDLRLFFLQTLQYLSRTLCSPLF